MVEFIGEQTKALIGRKSRLSGLFAGAFALALCSAVAVACLTPSFERYAGLIITLIVICGVSLVSSVALFVMSKVVEKRLSDGVATTLAEAMAHSEDLLKGDVKIAFNATYAGDKVTLSRVGSLKEITFDLSGIKKLPRMYAYFGTRLTEYLEGYYALHMTDGYESVIITDCIGKEEEVLYIVQNCVSNAKVNNNYFIKRGLIK